MARRLASRRLASRRLGTDTRRDGRVDRFAALPVDATPPILSAIAAVGITATGATITWTTNESADSQVEYGTDDTYGSSTTLDSTLAIDHVVALSGLSAGTYHYRVKSRDLASNLAISDDQTFDVVASDTTAPVISSQSQSTTDTTVTVHWRTDEPATSQVEYGPTASYGTLTPLDAALVLVHDVLISGLPPTTLYHYRSRTKDAAGNEAVSSDRTWTTTATPDTTAPVVSNVAAVSTNPATVSITWTTDEASDSQVEYGPDNTYGSSTTLAATLVTSHNVAFGGLSAGTTYHYRVKSRDASGNLRTDIDRTFKTADAAPDTWADSDPPSGTTTSAITLNATEAGIGGDVVFTEGATTLLVVTAEFRFADGSGRRDALDFWPTRPTSGSKNVYGSILDLAAGTAYQIRLRFFWSDGSSSYRVGSTTTRSTTIALAATLAATRFVDPVNGNDANAGTSAVAAWKTYAKFAAAYPSGGIVKFLSNGVDAYLTSASPALNRGTVTMITDCVVVDDTNATEIGGQSSEITANGRVTIEPPGVTSPTGTGAAPNGSSWVVEAPWVSVTLGGNQVWQWTGCPVSNPERASYAATRGGDPQQLASWILSATGQPVDPAIDTPTKWAAVLYTNQLYRYGFYADPSSPTTIYCRLPGDLDPRTQWLWFGNGAAVLFNSANSRISGFRIHDFRYAIQPTASGSGGAGSGFIVDRNILRNCYRGVYNTGGADAIFERNIWADTKVWADQTALVYDTTVIPWKGVKEQMVLQDGSLTTSTKLLGNAESTAFYPNSGARKAIIRYNTLLEGFNGVGIPGSGSNSTTRNRGDNSDCYRNLVQRMADDAFEPENTVINVRIWQNTIRECLTALSIAPLHFGPLYYWRNSVWKIGSLGTGRAVNGTVRPSGKGIKFTSQSAPEARIYLLHNSFDIDQTDPNTVQFAGISNAGSTNRESFWMKNNIITATSYVVADQTLGRFIEDYNFLCTTDASRGFRVGTTDMSATPTDYDNTSAAVNFARYRIETGQGEHTNIIDGVTKEINATDWLTDIRAMWTNRASGDLTLVAGAQAINRGVVVPNISDQPGINYNGAAPDLGAFERAA